MPGDTAVPESSQLHVRFPPLLGLADLTLALHLGLGVAQVGGTALRGSAGLGPQQVLQQIPSTLQAWASL